ncbi:MAG: phosphatase PAP2 family protein [Paracoccaceae bacterium]
MASATGRIMARDGISGVWQDVTPQQPREFGVPDNLQAWGSPSQQVILANEVLSRVTYGADLASQTCNIYALDIVDASGPAPSVGINAMAHFSAPTPEDFVAQARLVHDYADLRIDRMVEISDQTGGIFGYFAPLLPVQPAQMPHTMALVQLAMDCALHMAQQVKQTLACRRPDAVSAQIQPIIATPSHASLPSGHATEAFAVAETLRQLIPDHRKASGVDSQLIQMAARIAANRTVAGVHFPVDSFAGAMLGFCVADLIATRSGQATGVTPSRFTGAGAGTIDFFTSQVWQNGVRQSVTTDDGATLMETLPGLATTDRSDLLLSVWNQAAAEWEQ